MTTERLRELLRAALAAAESGDDEILDRALIEIYEEREDEITVKVENRLLAEASKIPGGYRYDGICSSQLCFYLRDGGELRFITCEADDADGTPSDNRLHIDHYNGDLPPGITGPAWKTGASTK